MLEGMFVVSTVVFALFSVWFVIAMVKRWAKPLFASIAVLLAAVVIIGANAEVVTVEMADVVEVTSHGDAQLVAFNINGHIYEGIFDEEDVFEGSMGIFLANNNTSSPFDDKVVGWEYCEDMTPVIGTDGYLIMFVTSIDELPTEYVIIKQDNYDIMVEKR